MRALELQKFVVAAAIAIRILAAHIRTRFVDRATSLVGIEEAADRLVHVIALMTQNLLVRILGLVVVREASLRFLVGQPEVPCEPCNIELTHSDACMAAAVARTFQTIELGLADRCAHDATLLRLTNVNEYAWRSSAA